MSEIGPDGWCTRANDTKFAFGNARDAHIESQPGLVNRAALNATEIYCSDDTSCDDAISHVNNNEIYG